jgi:hypothetical protein
MEDRLERPWIIRLGGLSDRLEAYGEDTELTGDSQLTFHSGRLTNYVGLTRSREGMPSSAMYVVQTNAKILQRCLLMTTDPGDLVLTRLAAPARQPTWLSSGAAAGSRATPRASPPR